MYQTLYKKTCKSFCLFILLGIITGQNSLFAQEKPEPSLFTYTGKIIDPYGKPISDVLVTATDDSFMTATDENGVFDLGSLRGKQIRLVHPGYLNREIQVKSDIKKEKIFIVRLEDKFLKDPEEIDVLYGKATRNSYLGSASTIYTNQLTTTMGNTFIPALQGSISGLYVEQYSGTRTQYTRDVLENVGLIGIVPEFNLVYNDNSQFNLSSRGWIPEVVVDGVQRDLYSLDSEAIESVSLQKDALSSIMLGMRSSAGVLVVTTKEPVKEGFQLSFTGRFGIQSALKKPEPLSSADYVYLFNEAFMNDGKSPYYTQEQYEAYRDGTNPLLYPNVNWFDETMKKNSAIQTYNLNASGGNNVAQYFVSLGYMNEEGLFRSGSSGHNTNLAYERYLITSKINVNITDEFKIGATLMGRIEDTNQPGAGYSSIMKLVMEMPNNAIPVYNPNGSFGGADNYRTNPLGQTINSGYQTTNTRDVLGSLNMNYDMSKLVKGLSVSAIGQISSQSRSAINRSMNAPTYQYYPASDGTEGSYIQHTGPGTQQNKYISVATLQYLYGQLAVNYKTNIGKHGLGIDLIGDMKSVTNSYDLPSTPANLTACAKYDYDMKYFAEAAVVRSYSNRYRPGARWGTFYAFGLGWDISRENFLAEAGWLDQFKIRGTFGRTGYGIDNSDYYSWRHSFSTYAFGGYNMGENSSYVTLNVYENNLPNPNITWEKAHKLNIGTDIALLDRRLVFSGDYYNNYMFDVLREREKSVELIGIKYSRENIEKRRYQGIDLSLTYQNNIGSFNYFITANWSNEKTKLIFMDEQYVLADYNERTGRPVGVRFGLIADGFFSSEEEIANSALPTGVTVKPGDIKYKDLNGDGVINTYDQAVIGNDKPLSFYGLNLGFEYRGFDFSVLFQGAYNRDIYMTDSFRQGFHGIDNGGYGQAYSHLMNRWTPETAEIATYPRLTAGTNWNNYAPGFMATSFWTESGNYFRLKNLNIGYTLPDGVTRNYLGGAKVRIFIGGQNLLTKSANQLVDPEVTNYESYPNLRNFHTGINIKF